MTTRHVVVVRPRRGDATTRAQNRSWELFVHKPLTANSRFVVHDVGGPDPVRDSLFDVLEGLRDQPVMVVFLTHGLSPDQPGAPDLQDTDGAPLLTSETRELLRGKLAYFLSCDSARLARELRKKCGFRAGICFEPVVFLGGDDDEAVKRVGWQLLRPLVGFLLDELPLGSVPKAILDAHYNVSGDTWDSGFSTDPTAAFHAVATHFNAVAVKYVGAPEDENLRASDYFP